MARLREPPQLRVPGRTVTDVVAGLRAGGKVSRSGAVRMSCSEDGRVRITEASRSSPPSFAGQLRQDGPDTVLDGEVRETFAGRFIDLLFVGLTVFMAAVAILLAVFDLHGGAVGIGVCGVGALLFFGVVLLGRKVRGPAFAAQARMYRDLLRGRLGIEGAADVPPLDAEDAQRVAAVSLALYVKLHHGAPLHDCAAEAAALTDLIVEAGIPRSDARLAVEGLAEEFGRSSPQEQAEILERLRAQQSGV